MIGVYLLLLYIAFLCCLVWTFRSFRLFLWTVTFRNRCRIELSPLGQLFIAVSALHAVTQRVNFGVYARALRSFWTQLHRPTCCVLSFFGCIRYVLVDPQKWHVACVVIYMYLSTGSTLSAVILLKCLRGLAPSVPDELHHPAKSEFRRRLRSASSHGTVCPPYHLSTYGDQAFPVTAVRIWNSLPQHITSVPSRSHFPSSALAWRHTSLNSVTRNYCCRAREVTLSFMDTLIALTYLLTCTESKSGLKELTEKQWL